MSIAAREDRGVQLASAEIVVAPLAQADYVIELTATKDGKTETRFVAFRVVPN